jgi:transposase
VCCTQSRSGHGSFHAGRLDLRQKQSAPVLVQLRQKLLGWKELLLPKHPMAEAISYTLGQWTELNAFCLDGAVPIDNNISEREIKTGGAEP